MERLSYPSENNRMSVNNGCLGIGSSVRTGEQWPMDSRIEPFVIKLSQDASCNFGDPFLFRQHQRSSCAAAMRQCSNSSIYQSLRWTQFSPIKPCAVSMGSMSQPTGNPNRSTSTRFRQPTSRQIEPINESVRMAVTSSPIQIHRQNVRPTLGGSLRFHCFNSATTVQQSVSRPKYKWCRCPCTTKLGSTCEFCKLSKF